MNCTHAHSHTHFILAPPHLHSCTRFLPPPPPHLPQQHTRTHLSHLPCCSHFALPESRLAFAKPLVARQKRKTLGLGGTKQIEYNNNRQKTHKRVCTKLNPQPPSPCPRHSTLRFTHDTTSLHFTLTHMRIKIHILSLPFFILFFFFCVSFRRSGPPLLPQPTPCFFFPCSLVALPPPPPHPRTRASTTEVCVCKKRRKWKHFFWGGFWGGELEKEKEKNKRGTSSSPPPPNFLPPPLCLSQSPLCHQPAFDCVF